MHGAVPGSNGDIMPDVPQGLFIGAAFRALILGTAAATLIALPSQSAQAQSGAGVRTFAISAQPLLAALQQFTEQSGIQVSYPAELGHGAQAAAVSGNFSSAEALSRLLTGTGLTFRQTGTSAFTLERAPRTADGAVQLGPVRVEGNEEAGTIEGRRMPAAETSSSYVASYAPRISATATKTDTPIVETPQSISIITREALDTQGATNLADALRYSAGIGNAAYLNGNGDNYDIFTIRGFSNSNSGLLRDGMRLNYNSFDAPSETYGQERVEVLKGPSGVMYGQSGPSGVINLVSKRPTLDSLHEFELQGGTFDRYQVAIDHGGRIDRDGVLSYRLTALARQSGSWTDYGQNDRLYIAPALSIRPDERTNLTILGYYQNSKSSYYSGVPYAGSILPNPNGRIPRDRYLGDPSLNYWDTDAFYLGYLFDRQLSSGLTFKSSLRYSESKLDYGYLYLDALGADNRTLTRGAVRRHDDSDTLTADNNLQAKWSGLGGEHVTMIGIDYGRSHYQRTRWFADAPSIDIYNPTYGNIGTLTFAAPRIDDPIRYQQTGIYLQQQSKFADHLVVTLNGRKDWAETQVTARTTGTKTTTKDDAFTFRGGLTWLAPKGFAPYFSYAESFEPSSGSYFDGRPFVPTTGRQYEAGIKFQPQGSDTLVTLAAYHLAQRNVATPDPDQINRPNAQVQTGEIRSKGIEAEIQSDVTRNLRVRGSLSLIDAEVTKSNIAAQVGLKPVDTPATIASLWADYTIRDGVVSGLSFGAGGRYSSGSYDLTNSVKTDGRTVFDALVAYQADQWRLAVNATNLFDKTYLNSCYSGLCWYGRPRTVDVSLRFNY